jgi:hypothetical protein
MKIVILLLTVVPSLLAARLQLLDISPEEAQKLITQQSLELRYAKLLSSGRLGSGIRGHGGIDYFNGQEIDNPDDYVEDVYEANQFHGQDGLGRSMFGYTDYNQARLEARNTNGEVRGQYQYIDPFGEEVSVQYWSDSVGFHQLDNRPKIELIPVAETPEVRQAREEHERAWKAAAELAAQDPDPMSDIYNKEANKYDQRRLRDPDQELEGQVSNQHQSLVRYPQLAFDQHIKPLNVGNDDDSIIVEAAGSEKVESRSGKALKPKPDTDVEEQSEPRGFFYNIDYPVVVVKGPDSDAEPSQQVKLVTPDSPKKLRVSEEVKDGTVPIDAVHDTQVSPKQRQRGVQRRQ